MFLRLPLVFNFAAFDHLLLDHCGKDIEHFINSNKSGIEADHQNNSVWSLIANILDCSPKVWLQAFGTNFASFKEGFIDRVEIRRRYMGLHKVTMRP